MDARRQRLIQRRGWDRAATCYEELWARQLRPAHDLLLRRAELVAGERVIDIACGTGLVTLAAASTVGGDGGSGGRVTATDLSPRMVVETGARAVAARLTNVDPVACGAEQLDTDGPFDVALCSLGLMYVPDPLTALTEMHRVVRPGGRVAVSVWGERRNCGWADLFGIVDGRVASDVCPLFFALGAPGALVIELERAGFVDVDCERLSSLLEFVDDEEAIGAAFLGGPVALAYGRFDEATRRSVEREYLDSLAGYRTVSGTYRVPGEFVVAQATLPDDRDRSPNQTPRQGAMP
jgi:ubiquinone/menaquinone biosynthesis C-methylase UbiE